MMNTSIVWFKTDLRVHDNETLIKAIESSDEIIPVYCFDDEHFKITEYGFNKTGTFRAQFLLESLKNLDENLRKLGSGLLVTRGKPEYELFKIAQKYHVKKVYAKKEVAYEEKQTEVRVEKELWKIKCELNTFSTSTLYDAQDLPFSIKDIPDVFTNFRKRTEKEAQIRNIFLTPKVIKSPLIPELILPKIEQLGLTKINTDNRTAFPFKGGESEAYKRLNYYFNETAFISKYKETRNNLIGPDYSSKFSAWLAIGCLSPRKIYYELKKFEEKFGANESTYWLIFELLWRDYFRFMMKKYRHQFFLKTGIKASKTITNNNNEKNLLKWITGETKNNFINANMIELKLTGFMSNRGRQNVASYLCHDLKVDWRFGAAYFEQQLIDYDVCSNWGNWAYLAGVGNDPRGNRYFNIDKQANEYDSKHEYRNLWIQQI